MAPTCQVSQGAGTGGGGSECLQAGQPMRTQASLWVSFTHLHHKASGGPVDAFGQFGHDHGAYILAAANKQ